MKAITVIEDQEGVVVVTSTGETYSEGIDLLHKGIAELVKFARRVNE